jgi:hypothetical protein
MTPIRRSIFISLVLVSLSFTSSKTLTNTTSAQNPVARTVKLGATNPTSPTLQANNDNVDVSVTVVSSSDVPNGVVSAKVDFLEVSNFQNVAYSVNPPSRTKTQVIAGGGVSTTITFNVRTTTNTTSTTDRVIASQFRLDAVSIAGGGVAPTVEEPVTLNISITVPGTGEDDDDDDDGGGGGGGDQCDLVPQACDVGYVWSFIECACVSTSPIIIDTAGDGYNLTNPANGVRFDLNGNGVKEQTSWTVENSDDAFLFLDRNGNGVADNGLELFGNFTNQLPSPHANGFLALAEYDKQFYGGNGDRVITNKDTAHSSLRLWRDLNHNGISEPEEIFSLGDVGIKSIDTRYRQSKRRDQHGNEFRYRAKIYDDNNTPDRWCWDVFLRTQR